MIVQRIRLHHVDDVKSIDFTRFGVVNSKVVELCVSFGVGVG